MTRVKQGFDKVVTSRKASILQWYDKGVYCVVYAYRDMEMHFEKHNRANESRLEAWRKEITEMRRMSWPYRRIAEWLFVERKFKVSSEAIRQFCQVRNIVKATQIEGLRKYSDRAIPRDVAQKPAILKKSKVERVFEYDDSKPIDIKR